MIPLIALLAIGNQSQPPAPNFEFRAAWVATVDDIDFPSKRGISTDQARKELTAIVDKACELHLNALIFQVRPAADAMYWSPYEPWSEYLTGQQGKAPDPAWDPLEFLINQCHRRGLELHAWMNPFRAWHPTAKGQPAMTSSVKQHPNWIKNFGNLKWIDPGNADARQHVINVARDLLTRYDLDGLHIDDYFYPYPEKNAVFDDASSYGLYRSTGGRMNVQDWRRDCVNQVVKGLSDATHSLRPGAKFGISPFGIARPGVPPGIKAGVDQYNELYADAPKWLSEGWCDYLSPQLYWKIDQKPQAFGVLLAYWQSQNRKNRHIWPGLYTSQVQDAGWSPTEIANQISLTRSSLGQDAGHAHFSFKILQTNAKGILYSLSPLYNTIALVPPSPWLAGGPTAVPNLYAEATPTQMKFSWNLDAGTAVPRRWLLRIAKNGVWQDPIILGMQTKTYTVSQSSTSKVTNVALAGVGINGVIGPYANLLAHS